ncbi:MAG: type II secretion system protein GspE [Deltaproteobacteria bacterium HGW-Deltaproteobacteria-21]|nr:MAG: type II secretion system protein GspE [Deltaproteobacteria bacterium HGW-Deltaproteobacteria-21]
MNRQRSKEEPRVEGNGGNGGSPESAMAEEERLARWAEQLGIPFKKRILEDFNLEEPMDIPIQYFKRLGIIPLSKSGGILTVALNDPGLFQAADDLAQHAGCESAALVLSPLKEIHAAINLLFDQSSEDAEKMVQDLEASDLEGTVRELDELEDLLDVSHDAPIIRLVNTILTQALRRDASDIHIGPFEKEVKVRFRIDGILYEVFVLPKKFHAHIVSRLKIMAGLDIAEKRVPQDGRMKIKVANKTVDVRASVIPMAFGERIVLRLLDKGVSLLGLDDMGLTGERLALFGKMIVSNSGILLVTGPTGSGKSTTLYAALGQVNSMEKNILTIEDPIEYELKDVGQIQVNPKTGLTFARGLRSILRHDPDIIMVGEIRDLETVEIAIQASLTGHLVFSTLHTNDAAGALTRLVDMGVEPFLIASSLLGVVAQRLVRRICPDCKEPYRPDPAVLKEVGLEEDHMLWKGKGCPSCMESGYRGRTGIFELLIMDNEVRRLLTSGSDSVAIKEAAVGKGMTTLFEDGLRKVREGITTLSEVMRVTQK